MSRTQLLGALAMAVVILASNYLVTKYLGNYLTYGAFTYPFAFLVTDLMNRLEGPQSARRIVFVGFIMGLICSFIGSQIIVDGYPLVTLRVAIGSATAFLLAQLLDVTVFDKLRGGAWWRAPVFSSFVGSAVDTALFFFIAFSATQFLVNIEPLNDVSSANENSTILGLVGSAPFWVSMAIADYLVKLFIALIALIPYRQTVKFVEN